MNKRDPRYDCLFEPLQIGPVQTKNRFYQVPHCSGMGRQRPQTLAAMRGMKAEGGWGVVCTEYCSVHPSSDDAAYQFATLWDDGDVKANALMVDAVHKHEALAGVELWLGGNYISNYDSRMAPLGLQSRPSTHGIHPVQSKRIDKQDIRNLLRWHANAARRAVDAGFDIIYVYATHGYLVSEFLDASTNDRTDEYGGSLQNRVRIVKELIETTREAVGDKCAIATRFSVDLADTETYDAFALLAELPDLWDLTVPDYDIEMGPSRYVREAALTDSVAKAKVMTSKPVVAVGRFTSPDTMARVIRDGTQDLIGAARPSIADPFLPAKIDSGRADDIRECIGCNVCYAHNSLGIPIRCTQNPTMGEEWRKNWHPEIIKRNAISSPDLSRVLVVGAGPAGLEAARVLGERGYEVLLAEARTTIGGRVARESKLAGLSEWSRVADWRLGQLNKLPNVSIYLDSKMNADDAINTDVHHIIVATGSSWTTDGIGRHRYSSFTNSQHPSIVSADRIMDNSHTETGKYIIFDDDHYYLGPVLAAELLKRGNQVVLVTPLGRVCDWGRHTDEHHATNRHLFNSEIEIITNRLVENIDDNGVTISCVFTGVESHHKADWLIPLTRQQPNDSLHQNLLSHKNIDNVQSVQSVGDCLAPGLIASAVYSGYETAINLEREISIDTVGFKREMP